MTRTPHSNYIVAFMAVVMALGCAWTARRGDGPVSDPRLRPPAAVRGAQVFTRHCQSCHPGPAAMLATGPDDRPLPAALIALQVRHGFGRMPAFSADVIDDAALTDLADYLVHQYGTGQPAAKGSLH
jgi:mono/diheme cytochrome c family protein